MLGNQRTSNLGPGARSFTPAESARLRQRVRESTRPATPAERIAFKWFCIGAAFTLAILFVLALWVRAGAPS